MPHSRAPAPPRRLIIASANTGKIREFRALLEGLPFEVIGRSSCGVAAPDETGSSFLENALLKARHAARMTACAAIADDSGLEVDALGGAPGIHSARYAGERADDAMNNAKLLEALSSVPPPERSARYRCALVYVDGPDDPTPLTAAACWAGLIVDRPRGSGGFGYDPYFWLPELNMTAAELDPGVKNHLSHRGKALRSLRAQLEALR
jgi:XTP/dITP diphosphohydrolase